MHSLIKFLFVCLNPSGAVLLEYTVAISYRQCSQAMEFSMVFWNNLCSNFYASRPFTDLIILVIINIEFITIEMLLSRKSSYHQNKPQIKQFSSSMNKTLSVYAQQVNDNKYLQENMLNKLLRPPAKKQNKGVLRKYDPQFQKPDVQKLIHENNLLKQQITCSKKTIMELRLKLREVQKKMSKLQQNQFEQLQAILSKEKANKGLETRIKVRDEQQKSTKRENDEQQQIDQVPNKRKQTGSVHTQILKKKIQQLHTKWVNAQTEIKRLRKLPSSSIYQQNNIQKQHLLAQTIRLKSILTPYENLEADPAPEIIQTKTSSTEVNANNANISSSINNTKFQQQFLKMLKQENEKLKATIRLLQNDKILMKARQTTQTKQSNDLKKELEDVKNKLVKKESQIQKLANENQNLLFKKAAQFRLQKEDKQNKLIFELSKTIQQLRSQKKKISEQNQQLIVDNLHLKQKQKNKNIELMQKDQQLQKVKVQIAEIRNDYEARIKSLQMNKIHTKDSGFGMKSSKGRFLQNTRFGYQKNLTLFGENFPMQDERKQNKNKNVNWGKPVKFQQLDFSILKIWALKQQKLIQNYEDLMSHLLVSNRPGKNNKVAIVTFQQLYNIFKSPPLNLSAKHSRKLAKYIFSDHCEIENDGKVQQPIIEYSLAVTIIKAAINQFTQCLNDPNVLNSWKCFLSKSKKMIRDLEELREEMITKEVFVEIVIKNKTTTLDLHQINFMLLYGFSPEYSIEQILLNRKKILQCMYGLMGDPKYLTSIFIRSGFTHFLPQSSCHTNSQANVSSAGQKNTLNAKNVFDSIYTAIEKGVNRARTNVYSAPTKQNMIDSNKAKTQACYDLKELGLSQFEANNEKCEADSLNEYKTLNIQKVFTQQDDNNEEQQRQFHSNSIIRQQNFHNISENSSSGRGNDHHFDEDSNIFGMPLGEILDEDEDEEDEQQESQQCSQNII